MRLLIAAIGKLKQGPERELFAHYLGRAEAAGRKLHLSPLSVVEVAESKAATAPARRKAEGEALLAKVPSSHSLICLDRTGVALSSEAFAGLLAKLRDGGQDGVAFLIGGADGLASEVLARAARTVSLGPMTLPHGLARIVLAEQIYRAATILAGHPYHRT
jgi:23S rRNA (pseudouridine1915-N3)-methyltransferase